jgi:transposase InsO family protein
MLTVIDEYSRECLAIRAERSQNQETVLETLADLFLLLNGEIFYTLKEAKVLIEQWRVHYNTVRPHSSLGYRPPAPQAINPLVMPASATQQ